MKQHVKWTADRAATLILGQIPLMILTSGRNSPLAWLSQMDFSEAMVFHRWIARCLWTCVNIHLGCFTIRALQTGDYAERFSLPYWRWGIAVSAALLHTLCLRPFVGSVDKADTRQVDRNPRPSPRRLPWSGHSPSCQSPSCESAITR